MTAREYVGYEVIIDGVGTVANHKVSKTETINRMNFLANVLDRVDSVKSFRIVVKDYKTQEVILERKKGGLYG